MYGCEKCGKVCAIIFLALGVLFLIADLTSWNFFNIQWWTALFVAIGVIGLASNHCEDCQTTKKK
tara:strand:+ start:55 stop:249 length:195 start_codon:yes stop_codon:yes gene_type:complete